MILVGAAPILNKSQRKASLHGNIPIDSGHQAPQRSLDYMMANHKLDEWSLIHEELCPSTFCAHDNWTAIGMQNDQSLGGKIAIRHNKEHLPHHHYHCYLHRIKWNCTFASTFRRPPEKSASKPKSESMRICFFSGVLTIPTRGFWTLNGWYISA